MHKKYLCILFNKYDLELQNKSSLQNVFLNLNNVHCKIIIL